MSIGIVIPTFHEAPNIAAAVARLAPAAVVVADGGSGDKTVALAQSAGARVIVEAGGRGAQQNAGAALLGEVDTLLFLHADTRLPMGWEAEVDGNAQR